MDAQAASAASRKGASAGLVRADLTTLLKLAGPVIFSRLGIMTMGLTDAVVVGRYSPTQLGYHALAWSPTSVVVTVAIGLLTGVQVMTARAIGEGRRAAAGAVLRRGLVYAFWVGLAASLVLAAFGPLLLHSIGLPRDLADGATGPLVVFSLSMAPYAVSTAGTIWLEALSRPTPAMLMMWAANLVNLAIDLVLVPGRFGAPALGATGGACATLGSRTALMVAVLAYIACMREARALGVFDKPPREPAAEAEQRRLGFGAGVSNLFEVAAFAALNIIAGWLGGLAVAAWTIVLNVSSIVFMVPLGISTATAVMVGSAYGARDARGVNRASMIGLAVTAAFGVLVALTVGPARALIAGAYTTSAPVIAMAAPALALSCLFFIPDCLQVVTAQSLRARGDVWVPSAAHLISYVAVMGPLAWVLAIPLHMGLTGTVLAVVIASLLSAGLLLARFAMLARRGL
jgi:multidrug resistance protein, MATE family